jgi:endonuclease/exonuclease/phosphatase (EEP) superfamily protein YafD
MKAGPISPVRFAGRELLVSLCWLAVIGLGAFTILTMAGLTFHRAMAALQLVSPWLGLLAGVPLLVAVVFSRPALAVVSGLCVIANVVPVWGAVTSERTAMVSPAATSVYVANLRYWNPTPGLAARQAIDSGADVIVLIELTGVLVDAFAAAGADERYPFQSFGPFGLGVYSRRPLATAEVGSIGAMPTLSVDVPVGDLTVRLDVVHTQSPSWAAALEVWRDELNDIAAYTRTLRRPTVLAGDFNATRWHPGFRQILDGPVFDAHEAVGKGLTVSWPADGKLGMAGPFARLDHALVHDVGVVDVVDFPAAGSDHRPFMVTLVPAT